MSVITRCDNSLCGRCNVALESPAVYTSKHAEQSNVYLRSVMPEYAHIVSFCVWFMSHGSTGHWQQPNRAAHRVQPSSPSVCGSLCPWRASQQLSNTLFGLLTYCECYHMSQKSASSHWSAHAQNPRSLSRCIHVATQNHQPRSLRFHLTVFSFVADLSVVCF